MAAAGQASAEIDDHDRVATRAAVAELETSGRGGGSFVTQSASAGSIATDATGVPDVTISPVGFSFAPLGLELRHPAAEHDQRANTVMLTNPGSDVLQISSLTFSGSDPQDFLITSDGCLGHIAAGASCAIGVSFVPA